MLRLASAVGVALVAVAVAAVAGAYGGPRTTGRGYIEASVGATAGHAGMAGHAGTAAQRAPGTPVKVPSGPPPRLVVTAITPGSAATGVAPSSPLTVGYSEPLSGLPPLPTLNPPVAGRWTVAGAVLTFVPTGGWIPYTTETVTVPPGAKAVVGGATTTSAAPTTTTFRVAPGSELRLEQMLAELQYIPFNFVPTSLPTGVTTALDAEATAADAVSTSPLAGTLQWAYPNIPPSLSALWTAGQANVIDKGAVMAFESVSNLPMDGIAGPEVWTALLAAVAGRHVNPNPYDYLMASETLPETLQVWRAGQIIYTSPANTGVPGATTQPGTYPVYLREASGTMTGTDVNGYHYVDHGIPWIAYFNGGDAVHGYVRASYGFPQSNGCVELPVANAQQVWTMDPYGTLVTVLPPG